MQKHKRDFTRSPSLTGFDENGVTPSGTHPAYVGSMPIVDYSGNPPFFQRTRSIAEDVWVVKMTI